MHIFISFCRVSSVHLGLVVGDTLSSGRDARSPWPGWDPPHHPAWLMRYHDNVNSRLMHRSWLSRHQSMPYHKVVCTGSLLVVHELTENTSRRRFVNPVELSFEQPPLSHPAMDVHLTPMSRQQCPSTQRLPPWRSRLSHVQMAAKTARLPVDGAAAPHEQRLSPLLRLSRQTLSAR